MKLTNSKRNKRKRRKQRQKLLLITYLPSKRLVTERRPENLRNSRKLTSKKLRRSKRRFQPSILPLRDKILTTQVLDCQKKINC